MDILQKIKKRKEQEVAELKTFAPLDLLKKSRYYDSSTHSLSTALRRSDGLGVIAEFKKKSPSQGFINEKADVEEITTGYIESGASALSILTDREFFGGSADDLKSARVVNQCPILRKDFIIDQYQIHEAKSMGADAILLIAALLSKDEIERFSALAHDLGLEVLMEVHDKDEIDKYVSGIDVLGVNNRNLKNFTIDVRHSIDLYRELPGNPVKISESGIQSEQEMILLHKTGYQGFLIGTQFMKTSDPVRACRELLESYQRENGSL